MRFWKPWSMRGRIERWMDGEGLEGFAGHQVGDVVRVACTRRNRTGNAGARSVDVLPTDRKDQAPSAKTQLRA
ncbi:hypothetical protein GCM10009634_01710 [Saccharothrix xinjiangensis]